MIINKIREFIKRLFQSSKDISNEKNQITEMKNTSHISSTEQSEYYSPNTIRKDLFNEEIKYLMEKAECYIDSDNLQQALKCYDQLIEISVSYPHFFKRRAWLHRMLGAFDAAISDMNKAIELNPDDSTSYWERGACYAHRLSQITDIGKDEKKSLLKKILQDYKGSVQRNPSSSAGWLAIIETEMLLHNWDDAISNYGACKPYIDSREYHLVRAWLGCLSLIFADDPIEEEDKKPLDDNSIRLRRTSWCVSEIDSLITELEQKDFNKEKLEKAREIHQTFLNHFDEPAIRFQL